jgi:hypothetical protein
MVVFMNSGKDPLFDELVSGNIFPVDVDVNLFKCYGILSIMEPDWKLITEIYNHEL